MMYTHIFDFLVTIICVGVAFFAIYKIQQEEFINHKVVKWLKGSLLILIPIHIIYIILHFALAW